MAAGVFTSTFNYGSPSVSSGSRYYSSALSALDKSATQQKADVRQRYKAAESAGVQDLVSRGLTGTTILPTMRMGYQREMEGALGRVEDSLNQQRVQLYAQQAQAAQSASIARAQLAMQGRMAASQNALDLMRLNSYGNSNRYSGGGSSSGITSNYSGGPVSPFASNAAQIRAKYA